MNRNLKIADSMLDLIGEIPLVQLNRIGRETGAEILAKPEFLNPSGSMKDRVALRMVEEAEAAGELKPGTRIVESMFHAHKDYALIAQNTGVELFGLTEQDRTFSVAKLFFVYGLGENLALPWYVGASIVLHPGPPRLAADVLDTIEQFKTRAVDVRQDFARIVEVIGEQNKPALLFIFHIPFVTAQPQRGGIE